MRSPSLHQACSLLHSCTTPARRRTCQTRQLTDPVPSCLGLEALARDSTFKFYNPLKCGAGRRARDDDSHSFVVMQHVRSGALVQSTHTWLRCRFALSSMLTHILTLMLVHSTSKRSGKQKGTPDPFEPVWPSSTNVSPKPLRIRWSICEAKR